MSLFGNAASGEPWGVDLLTTEYLFSGQVEVPAQKWGWAFLSPIEKIPAQQFEIAVSAVSATGALAAPQAVGTHASFGWNTALVAIIARDEPAGKAWDEWSAAISNLPLEAEMLVGPYSITGTVLTQDSTLQVVLNDRFPVRDATITRVDGAGDGKPIDAPKAMIGTSFLHSGLAH